jgi:hypothetical protein
MTSKDFKVGQRVRLLQIEEYPLEIGVVIEIDYDHHVLIVLVDDEYRDHSGDCIGWRDDGYREVCTRPELVAAEE